MAVPAYSPQAAYFGVYDGHSGRDAVDLIQQRLHNYLADELASNSSDVKYDSGGAPAMRAQL